MGTVQHGSPAIYSPPTFDINISIETEQPVEVEGSRGGVVLCVTREREGYRMCSFLSPIK